MPPCAGGRGCARVRPVGRPVGQCARAVKGRARASASLAADLSPRASVAAALGGASSMRRCRPVVCRRGPARWEALRGRGAAGATTHATRCAGEVANILRRATDPVLPAERGWGIEPRPGRPGARPASASAMASGGGLWVVATPEAERDLERAVTRPSRSPPSSRLRGRSRPAPGGGRANHPARRARAARGSPRRRRTT